jgi:hypothetical protein
MREAFVLRLSPDSDPERRHFVGWIEEVDTARELRFTSTDQLLQFLSQCLIEAQRNDRGGDVLDRPSKDDSPGGRRG